MGNAEQAMPRADEATRRFQARRLQQVLRVLLVAVSVIALQNLWAGVWHSVVLLLATDGALLLALRYARRGQVECASLLMLWSLTVLLTLIIWAGQGLRDSGVIGFPGILVFAAMLGNRRQLVALLAFMLVSFGLLALVNLQGWYVNPRPPVRLGTWHTLRVEFAGTRIAVSLNGKRCIELDDDRITGSGAVGVWTKADSVTAFDDFTYGNARP